MKKLTIFLLLISSSSFGAEIDNSTLDIGLLTKQLLSPVGSPERKKAADSIEDMWKKSKSTFGLDSKNNEQKRTDSFIQNTIKYLRSDTTCSEEQKFTLYRGVGAQSVISRSYDTPGVHYTLPIKSLMRTTYTEKKGSFPHYKRGEFLYNSLSNIEYKMKLFSKDVAKSYSDLIEKLSSSGDDTVKQELKTLSYKQDGGFAFMMGAKRIFEHPQSGEMLVLNFDYDGLASDQTTGDPWSGTAGSPFSPFISTSMSEESAYKFGGRRLRLRVCPERVLPTTSPENPMEQEFFIPLFILPEEMASITPEHIKPTVESKVSEYQKCFAKIDTPWEFQGYILQKFDEISSKTTDLKSFRESFMKMCDFK